MIGSAKRNARDCATWPDSTKGEEVKLAVVVLSAAGSLPPYGVSERTPLDQPHPSWVNP